MADRSFSVEAAPSAMLADEPKIPRFFGMAGTCAHCRDLYTFEGAFLRTVAELLDAPADDTGSLRSRIILALADAGLTPQR